MTHDEQIELLQHKVSIAALLGLEPPESVSLQDQALLVMLLNDPDVKLTIRVVVERCNEKREG